MRNQADWMQASVRFEEPGRPIFIRMGFTAIDGSAHEVEIPMTRDELHEFVAELLGQLHDA